MTDYMTDLGVSTEQAPVRQHGIFTAERNTESASPVPLMTALLGVTKGAAVLDGL